jgi:hypothetical protein
LRSVETAVKTAQSTDNPSQRINTQLTRGDSSSIMAYYSYKIEFKLSIHGPDITIHTCIITQTAMILS